jgi:hypothetical protein
MEKIMSKERIYYAHSKKIYGTPNETEELKYIKEKFPYAKVICPHTTVGELKDFQDYLHIVDCYNTIIASEVKGFISRGVFSEIARGFSNGIQVYVLRKQANKHILYQVIGIEIHNQSDWVYRFGKIICTTIVS